MRYTRLVLMLLGFAAALCAADPYAGTWKMNTAKTKFKLGTAPKEQTITITDVGSDSNVTIAGTAADGTRIALSYTIPTAGGTGKIESPVYDGISSRVMGPNERMVQYLKNSITIYTAHSKVSADGNSLSVQTKGRNASGKYVDATAVYEKQK